MSKALMAELGLRKQADIDLCVAIVGGLVDSQLANDPGGTSWRRLVPRAIDMYADEIGLCPTSTAPRGEADHDPHHDAPTTRPRPPALDHETAMRLAATEYDRIVEAWDGPLRRGLVPPDRLPRVDVRDLATHVSAWPRWRRPSEHGPAEGGREPPGGGIDALTAVQVDQCRQLSPDQIVERFAGSRRGRRAAVGGSPAFVRRRTLPEEQVVGGNQEMWAIGFLTDVILTRDPWMHRVDLAHAVGTPMRPQLRPRQGHRRRQWPSGRTARAAVRPPPDRAGRRPLVVRHGRR